MSGRAAGLSDNWYLNFGDDLGERAGRGDRDSAAHHYHHNSPYHHDNSAVDYHYGPYHDDRFLRDDHERANKPAVAA